MTSTLNQRRATTSLDLMRRGPEGDPVVVVVKHHRDRVHFEHEARWLTAARHLPVAGIEAVMADRLVIATRFTPALTLADIAAGPATALALLSDLARVVAGLSVEGLIHGNLHASHVLRDRRGDVLVVSPAPTDDPEADLVGLARCCRQVMDTADAIAVERGDHPWTDRDRQRWQELITILAACDLGPHRAARQLETRGRDMGGTADGRLRRWLRS